jgi:hypothetical protein
MRKVYLPARDPPEYREWLTKRKDGLQKEIQRRFGMKVNLTLMDAKRILSKTNGIELNTEALEYIRKNGVKI